MQSELIEHVLGRRKSLFDDDIKKLDAQINDLLSNASVLVIGAAGSIGAAVATEVFKRDPRKLHLVDINENNLVEIVRYLRSSVGYTSGEFDTYAIDCGSSEFDALVKAHGPYDYVFNLSALKHVRSESNAYTLMRMLKTNIVNPMRHLDLLSDTGHGKYFCVSTDKAANPVNMMGGSKRLMEKFAFGRNDVTVSMARFANVAFSDGSLLHGFTQRLRDRHPISAPTDVRRYFLSPQEAGHLCILSCLFGGPSEIFFPSVLGESELLRFDDIARKFLSFYGYDVKEAASEGDARKLSDSLNNTSTWPCYFFESSTTGEKPVEEFFTNSETVNFERFSAVGVIESAHGLSTEAYLNFSQLLNELEASSKWRRRDLVDIALHFLPEMTYKDVGAFLNERM